MARFRYRHLALAFPFFASLLPKPASAAGAMFQGFLAEADPFERAARSGWRVKALKLPLAWASKQAMRGVSRLSIAGFGMAAVLCAASFALAQDAGEVPASSAPSPFANSYAPATGEIPVAASLGLGELKLTAQLTPDGADIGRGLVWR